MWQACSNSDHWCLPTEFLAPWAVAYCGFASDCLQHAARPACARLVRAQFGAGHRANHSRCVGSEALHGKIQRAHSLFVRLRSESSGTAVRYGSNTRRRISGSRTTMVLSRTTIHRKRGKLLRWGSPRRSIRLGPAAAALLHAEQRALLKHTCAYGSWLCRPKRTVHGGHAPREAPFIPLISVGTLSNGRPAPTWLTAWA